MHTARCNAGCAHCSTSCGPLRSEALPHRQLLRAMDQAAALADGRPLKFGITGGEPFLDLDGLRRLIAHGHGLGAEMGSITNAYWATSRDKAVRTLQPLKDAGLQLLAVSTSRFHQQFVPPSRVVTALAASRATGIQSVLKYVHTTSDSAPASIERWARSAGASRVEIIPVLPHLREGVTLPDTEYRREPGLPSGPCPGMQLTVGWDGEVYNCCTPGAMHPYFSVGNVVAEGLDPARDRFYARGKQRLLREHGPIRFAREAIKRGLGSRLPGTCTSVCELCTHIARDPELTRVANEVSDRFESRHLQRLIGAVTTAAPGPRTRPDGPSTTRGDGMATKIRKKQRSGKADGMTRQDRLRLSWNVFSDPSFRESLLRDPTVAARNIGITLPQHERDELLAVKEELRQYGEAIDTLVRLGKDVRKLWRSRDIALFGINRITDPGDWKPQPPGPPRVRRAR